ncbi:uncharacterized protein LOC581009 [Strongylocentrotus purpuratus]|uniref:Uncharacterized protein n=1 Tax=Strongylocentrotus purpuratus TaxID=7668 RepID=A0A7M7N8Z2_STRPU|nr:uncharacterized protein LOC581009 [Strongylocentrotus purpuratus]
MIYACDPGHLMDAEQDSVVLLCNTSSGEWSGRMPICNRIQCPDPAVPNFGSVEGSGRSYGDEVTFSCESNFRLLDPTVTSTCTQYGSWSEKTPTCMPDLSNVDVCPSGSWNYIDEACFLASDDGKDWAEARDDCATISPDNPYGQLAKIPDQSTQEFLAGKLQGRINSYWIGAFEGLKWYWEGSDSEAQYFSWADGEPNGATDEKICIQLKGVPSSEFDNYDWNDESCGVSNPFICEFEQACPVTIPGLADSPQVPYGTNCAVFVTIWNSWDNARSYCSDKSGQLVEIATEVQQQLLVSMANEEDDGSRPNWWIGGFRDDSKPDEEVLFLDGPAVTNPFWAPGQPSRGFERCTDLLDDDFSWNDERCATNRGYICQYPGKRGPQQCSDPGASAHGTYITSYPNWLFGSYVTFSCDAGYELDGGERIECGQDGSYSGDRPECKPVSCSSSFPTLPNSDLYEPNTTEYRSVVVYLCQEQYYPVGDVSSVCQTDSSWSQPTGRCEETLPTTLEISSTSISTTPSSGPGNPSTPSSGPENPSSPSSGPENPSTPSSGPGNPSTASSGPGNPLTSSLGPGNPSTSSSAPGNPSTPSLGPENPSNPSSGPGNPSTPSSGPGNPSTPSSAPGNPSTPSSAPGNPSTSSSGPENPSIPSSAPGNPSTPSSAPGDPSTPSSGPGNPSTPSSGPGNPSTSSSAPGDPSTPSPAPGNPSTPSSAPGNPSTSSSAPGNPSIPSSAPGNPSTPSSAPGNPSTPSSAPGNLSTSSSAPGNPSIPSSAPGNPSTPSSAPGNPSTSSLGPGNPSTPSSGPENRTTHFPGVGNATTVFSRTTASTDSMILLQCGYFSMTVTIPLTLVGGVTSGEDLHLLDDDDCTGMISEDKRFISITTNLTDCNNKIKEYDTQIVYSNAVVERTADSPITRLKKVYVPFSCAYNRSGNVELDSYQITYYELNSTKVSVGHYEFALDIFKDDDFEEKYADSEYPVDVNLDKELHFGASVPSQDGSLDVSIKSCVATPSASYNDVQWTIIRDGCAVEMSTHIEDEALGFVGVTMNTFRFVELGNRVYIHCDLLVCRAITGNESSECDTACVGTSGNRARRDVGENRLQLKRIMKGPLRLRRRANIHPSLDNKLDSEETPAVHPIFNIWIMTIVAMATLCVLIIGVLFVLMRRMTSYDQTHEVGKCPEKGTRACY